MNTELFAFLTFNLLSHHQGYVHNHEFIKIVEIVAILIRQCKNLLNNAIVQLVVTIARHLFY